MAKSKPKRSLAAVGESQQVTEETHADKFQEAMPKAAIKAKPSCEGRSFPQVSYTISPEDKAAVFKASMRLSQKKGRMVSSSEIIRAAIKLMGKHGDDELEV